MTRRASVFHPSLHRDRAMMGVEQTAFMAVAFSGAACFAMGLYIPLVVVVPVMFLLARWMTKKDHHFMPIFLRYMDEGDAYSALPRPADWNNRPHGWGRGLPC